jgi:hypothetical protein
VIDPNTRVPTSGRRSRSVGHRFLSAANSDLKSTTSSNRSRPPIPIERRSGVPLTVLRFLSF